MRWLAALHRWTGALLGLWLATMGATGAILVHRDAWIAVPHAQEAPVQTTPGIAQAVVRIMADPRKPRSITFATGGFGLHELTYRDGGGAYADSAGGIVLRWRDRWERPELWLFDLHRQFLAGEAGETLVGVGGLCGLFFVVSGTMLWWRNRRTFRVRIAPARLTRSAILRWHRDLGIVVAPLIALSLTTGTVLVFTPLTAIVFGPGAPATIARGLKAPRARPAKLADDLNWARLIGEARAHFPNADFGALILPGGEGGLITVRMRQPAEWLPKGRSTLWFAADSGRLIEARDPLRLPLASRAFDTVYPLHAAEVGGSAYRLLMTLSGLALVALGSLTVWTFWTRPRRDTRRNEPVPS